MTPSKTLLFFCVSFVAGIAIASIVKIPHITMWGILLLATILVLSSFIIKSNVASKIAVFGFCMLFFVLALARLQLTQLVIENDAMNKFRDTKQTVVLSGIIIDEPDIRESYQNLKVKMNNTSSIVLVSARLYPEYHYLDNVKITGNIKTPEVFDDFNYRDYLLKDRIYSIMVFPKIEFISREHKYHVFSFLYEKMIFTKNILEQSIHSSFSPPQNVIIDGIVFGNDKFFSEELKDKFNKTGLSHITAVSGGNIIILISMILIFLLAIGFWRQQALYLSIVFIWFYIMLVGLPSSGIRAGIMGSIFLFSQIFGRQNTSSRTIVLAASLMLLQNPLILFYDIGFQLSFLASMGIIYLKPPIDSLFTFIKDAKSTSNIKNMLIHRLKDLIDILSITVSAQIFTLPIIMYNFNIVSLVALPTNFLVLPIVPFLMVFGVLSSMFGVFSGFLGWAFALPCHMLIVYLLKILDLFYHSWSVIVFRNFSMIWLMLYYTILFGLVFLLHRKMRQRF